MIAPDAPVTPITAFYDALSARLTKRGIVMFEGLFQPMHLLVILVIAMIVFGPKKLPEQGLGRRSSWFSGRSKRRVCSSGDERRCGEGQRSVSRTRNAGKTAWEGLCGCRL